LADFDRIVIWAAVAVGLAPVWGTLLWELWQGGVRPRLVARDEIERAAATMLARHGQRAEQMAWIAEDRAWRYSDSFRQGYWRRVRKRVAAIDRETARAATPPPPASVRRRRGVACRD